jgi:uncharacterized protein YhhL (DUF1145 family)
MFGRLLAGIFATRIGVLNLLIPVSTICGALILALFGVHTAASVVVFAILYGFFSGSGAFPYPQKTAIMTFGLISLQYWHYLRPP